MRLRLDPWATEYGASLHTELADGEAKGEVVLDVEYPAEAWAAVSPGVGMGWGELLFLDGSRRVEARVLLEDDTGQVAFGALGTYGVGAVSCCPVHSRPAEMLAAPFLELERICTLSAGRKLEDFTVEAPTGSRLGALTYQVVSTGERDPEAVVRRLQVAMREAEKRLASRLLDAFPQSLVICDGPRPFLGAGANVVGYLKTIHEPRVGREQLAVVRRLEAGQRSPLYLVRHREAERDYFEWFFRLRDPRPWLYSLAGMVRLQAYAGANPKAHLAEVKGLADWLCGVLPAYASRQHQDPRAPQQLLPVRGLEAELGRRMGHAQLIRRRITRYLSLQGAGG
jgi:hypothetical protein